MIESGARNSGSRSHRPSSASWRAAESAWKGRPVLSRAAASSARCAAVQARARLGERRPISVATSRTVVSSAPGMLLVPGMIASASASIARFTPSTFEVGDALAREEASTSGVLTCARGVPSSAPQVMFSPPTLLFLMLAANDGGTAIDPVPSHHAVVPLSSFTVFTQDSGPVNYYSVGSEEGVPVLRGVYRPPLGNVVLKAEVPEQARRAVSSVSWRWRVHAFPRDGNDCSLGVPRLQGGAQADGHQVRLEYHRHGGPVVPVEPRLVLRPGHRGGAGGRTARRLEFVQRRPAP